MRVLDIIYRKFASNTTHCPVIIYIIATLYITCSTTSGVCSASLEPPPSEGYPLYRDGAKMCPENMHKKLFRILLDLLQIPSQQNRRLFLSLCTFYSIKNKLLYFPCDSVLPPALSCLRSLSYNTHALRVPFTHCNGLKFSFFNTTISLWNNLPSEAITSVTASNSFSLHCKIATTGALIMRVYNSWKINNYLKEQIMHHM